MNHVIASVAKQSTPSHFRRGPGRSEMIFVIPANAYRDVGVRLRPEDAVEAGIQLIPDRAREFHNLSLIHI